MFSSMFVLVLVVPIRAWSGPLVSRAPLTRRLQLPSQRGACTSCAVEEEHEDDAIDTLFAWMDDNGD
tara:strand:+ start:153 stop:353 length:201 start_codon:yes stop_codon:yes gene_type:complete